MKFKSIGILLFIALFFSSYATPYAHPDEKPNITSEAAILIDGKSGQILFEKNASRQMYPASITKMITGLVAIEKGNLSDIVSVSKKATEVIGTSVYLLEDEEVTLERLVKGLLINSGNDAGAAIAEHISGSQRIFSAEMNNFVESKIGVYDSNFTNPHGLFDENHYTTAYDMAKIAQYAMGNDLFKEIVGTRELEWSGEGWETTLYNHHRLLGHLEGVTGIKNGYVSKAGFTLVTSAERNGAELIAVTLNAPTNQKSYDDTTKLLNQGFKNYAKIIYQDFLNEARKFQKTPQVPLFPYEILLLNMDFSSGL
ncbi:D-alanyl-D-alanine carboxypeptidase family protein [Salipaludibacillus sp. HK11]|uniref:D-alanyl-D-alanine carboxypeptidase family protein n=1 Tax=Salipaludibacillus sp. HK11 TaxID=3394320 RepID=UPI0039FDAA79